MTSLIEILKKAEKNKPLTREEAEFIIHIPQEAVADLVEGTFAVRKKYKGLHVGIQLLSNARSGNCSQDCAYCAQSASHQTGIAKYKLAELENLKKDQELIDRLDLARHCIGLSGIRFANEEIETFAAYVEELKKRSDTSICCSIGFLTEEQARRLKETGVNRINHNLNTSRRNYPNICTTHTYDERIANIKMLQSMGFEICCGGILGMGETKEDIIHMLMDIVAISPESVPINFLLPIDGTRLSGVDTSCLTPEYCLKLLCLTRLLLPTKDIRCAAGREVYFKGYEKQLFMVVDSIFASGYLTAGGQAIEDTIALVKAAGFESKIE